MLRCSPRFVSAGALVVGATVVAIAISAAAPATAPAPARSMTFESTTVDIVEMVGAWPTSWSATGTKSEPQYVEHLAFSRSGMTFALDIELVAQGGQDGGSTALEVTVLDDGRLQRSGDCGTGCTDTTVRGFLSTATLLSRISTGELADGATPTLRQFGDREVACVSDSVLFPTDQPFFLDPCFDLTTGAVLAHYSTSSSAYAGATLNPASVEIFDAGV